MTDVGHAQTLSREVASLWHARSAALDNIAREMSDLQGKSPPAPHERSLRYWIDPGSAARRHWRDDPRYLHWLHGKDPVLCNLFWAMTNIRDQRTVRLSVAEAESTLMDLSQMVWPATGSRMWSAFRYAASSFEWTVRDFQKEFDSSIAAEREREKGAVIKRKDDKIEELERCIRVLEEGLAMLRERPIYRHEPGAPVHGVASKRIVPLRGEPTSHVPALDPQSFRGGVYVVEGLFPGTVKIGQSMNIAKRLRELSMNTPFAARLVAVFSTLPSDEYVYHRRWQHLRVTTKREYFWAKPDLVEDIERCNKKLVERVA